MTISDLVDMRKLLGGATLVCVAVVIFGIHVQGVELGFNFDTYGLAGTAAGINWFIWGLFRTYLWRWKCFRGWLVRAPNFNGTWSGKLVWKDKVGNELRKNTKLEIKQTLTRITVDLSTDETESGSEIAGIVSDDHRGTFAIDYTYRAEPSILERDRNSVHYGAAHLKYSARKDELSGSYWTDRSSKGSMKLKRKK